MSFFRRLLRTLGFIRPTRLVFELDRELVQSLNEMAEQNQRTPEQAANAEAATTNRKSKQYERKESIRGSFQAGRKPYTNESLLPRGIQGGTRAPSGVDGQVDHVVGVQVGESCEVPFLESVIPAFDQSAVFTNAHGSSRHSAVRGHPGAALGCPSECDACFRCAAVPSRSRMSAPRPAAVVPL